MQHYHAGQTNDDENGKLFATESEARRYLATEYAELASSAVSEWLPDAGKLGIVDCDGIEEWFRFAISILRSEGTITDEGRVWVSDLNEHSWLDICEKAECGTWVWAAAS